MNNGANRKIQKQITEDIRRIRNNNKKSSVNNIVMKIKQYYKDNKYNEDILLYRIDKLSVDFLFQDSMFSAGVSTIVGLMVGLFVSTDRLKDLTNNIFINLILNTILAIFLIIVSMGIIIFITKRHISKEKGNTNYLSKKEIEIIEDILEKNIKIGEKRKYRYFNKSFKRRP